MAQSTSKPAKVFFPHLDGLRFICFLSVFFFHSFHTEQQEILNDEVYRWVTRFLFANGNLGVNCFFVLSGFLITYLLLKEEEVNGKVNVGAFYLRRILRIWPLFYFCVLWGFFAFPQLKKLFGAVPNETANIEYYLLFLNNFDFIANGLPDASILGVLWSIAVEEQFYLIWPLFFFLLPSRRYPWVFGLIILSSWIFRIIYDSEIYHEHHTLSCIGDMAVGGAGAYLVYYSSSFKNWIKGWKKYQIAGIYLLCALVYLFKRDLYHIDAYRPFERTFIAIIFLAIILEQCFANNSLFKFGNWKFGSSLGKITYGLYCLHFIGILITITLTKILGWNQHLWQVLFLETAVALIISIVISKISYQFYEKPFLKLKNKFSYVKK